MGFSRGVQNMDVLLEAPKDGLTASRERPMQMRCRAPENVMGHRP